MLVQRYLDLRIEGKVGSEERGSWKVLAHLHASLSACVVVGIDPKVLHKCPANELHS